MSRLPLFIETEEFRAVHAACIQSEIDDLRRHAILGMLSERQLIRAVRKSDDLYKLAKAVAKVPEARLPYPHSFPDTGGKVRRDVRLNWWRDDAENWYQIAMSVSDIDNLPDEALPTDLLTSIYPRVRTC